MAKYPCVSVVSVYPPWVFFNVVKNTTTGVAVLVSKPKFQEETKKWQFDAAFSAELKQLSFLISERFTKNLPEFMATGDVVEADASRHGVLLQQCKERIMNNTRKVATKTKSKSKVEKAPASAPKPVPAPASAVGDKPQAKARGRPKGKTNSKKRAREGNEDPITPPEKKVDLVGNGAEAEVEVEVEPVAEAEPEPGPGSLVEESEVS
jgi:hypothetical protein